MKNFFSLSFGRAGRCGFYAGACVVIGAAALFFCAFGTPAEAATNVYVTPTGAGTKDGTSWSNAFAGFGGLDWSKVSGGTTVWIAGGVYGPLTVGKSGSSGSPIVFKRATSQNAEATGAAGWQSSFDSQVQINATGWAGIAGWGIDNITVDGQVSNGIKINGLSADIQGDNPSGIRFVGNNWKIQYMELAGPQCKFRYDAIQFGSTGAGLHSGVYIGHMNIHNFTDGIFAAATDNVIFEYNYFHDDYGCYSPTTGEYIHDNVMYLDTMSHGVIRYNEMTNYGAEGIVFTPYGAGMDDWKIYGNVFHDSPTDYRTSRGCCSRGIEWDPNYQNSVPGSNFYIYNNVFANLWSGIRASYDSRFPGPAVKGGQIYNNIFYDAPLGITANPISHDYNWFSAADDYSKVEPHAVIGGGANPFVNFAGMDYHITSAVSSVLPRNKGIPEAAEYSMDKDGVVRGSDGAWDIGAYEYGTPSAGGATGGTGSSGGTGGTSCFGTVAQPPAGSTFPCPILSISSASVAQGTDVVVTLARTDSNMSLFNTIYVSDYDAASNSYLWRPCSTNSASTVCDFASTPLPPANRSVDTIAYTIKTTALAKGKNHYVLSWDWKFNGTCWYGPNASSCAGPGSWRLQKFMVN